VAAAIVAALLAGAWPAHPARAESGAERLAAYLAVVERYRSGDAGGAAEALLGWRPRDVASVVSDLVERGYFVGRARTLPGAIDVVTVEAAALLHAQVALVLSTVDEDDARDHLRFADDLVRIAEEAGLRAGAADRSPPGGRPPSAHVTPRELDAAVAGLLLGKGAPVLALYAAERGLDVAPRDGRLLLVAGCAHEYDSLLQAQYLDAPFLAPARPNVQLLRDREMQRRSERLEAERNRAMKRFTEALLSAPDLGEARLRLGRLLAQEGDVGGAERLLEAVAAGPDRDPRYLAELFLGGLSEQRSDLAGAEDHYRRSLLAVPQSQAARLALARVLGLSGRAGAARTLVLETLNAAWPRDPSADPWWLYPVGNGPGAQRLLLDLVARVRAR